MGSDGIAFIHMHRWVGQSVRPSIRLPPVRPSSVCPSVRPPIISPPPRASNAVDRKHSRLIRQLGRCPPCLMKCASRSTGLNTTRNQLH